jgi:Phosphotransferase enzyme family
VGRTVTLVLVDATGAPFGALPPYDVPVPWWPEVADVLAGARDRYGVDAQVLRLLAADGTAPAGGRVAYVAEAAAVPPGVPLDPVRADLADHPRRAPYARPGGPAASVRWALTALGRPGVTAHQQRTWNLSAIWRLDAAGAPVAWLKQVPAFLAPEAAVLRLVGGVAPALVPRVLAAGAQGRALLAHVPGADRYGAGAAFRARVAAAVHPVQVHFASRVAGLLAAGVPDRRAGAAELARVAAPHVDSVPGLAGLVAGLPRRLAAVAACGLPATLVHGDLHPGNVRDDGAAPVVVDWGDAGVAHPAYDILRLTADLPAAEAAPLLRAWARRWRAAVPGCAPERAVALLRPVAELRAAAGYAGFLEHIEPSEWPYHAADVPDRLRAAVAAAAGAGGGPTVGG